MMTYDEPRKRRYYQSNERLPSILLLSTRYDLLLLSCSIRLRIGRQEMENTTHCIKGYFAKNGDYLVVSFFVIPPHPFVVKARSGSYFVLSLKRIIQRKKENTAMTVRNHSYQEAFRIFAKRSCPS